MHRIKKTRILAQAVEANQKRIRVFILCILSILFVFVFWLPRRSRRQYAPNSRPASAKASMFA